MTTASPTRTAESIEVRFQSAREFFDRRDPDPTDLELRRGGPPLAKGILWYDQATPIFVCLSCSEETQALRFAGDGRVEDPGERRAQAYRRLFAEDPTCDVCAGRLPEKVDR
jgi:hypothetical protein